MDFDDRCPDTPAPADIVHYVAEAYGYILAAPVCAVFPFADFETHKRFAAGHDAEVIRRAKEAGLKIDDPTAPATFAQMKTLMYLHLKVAIEFMDRHGGPNAK